MSGTGEGSDTYHDIGSSGTDKIVALSDNTSIGLAGDFSHSSSGIEVISAGMHSTVHVSGDNAGNVHNFSGVTIDGNVTIDGGYGDDTITGNGQDNVIHGGHGNDAIRGSSGDDELHGGLGDDTFLTTGSGDGTDTIDGGTGYDTWQGSNGNDYFRVTDLFNNLTSIENIDGSGGYDRILGTAGDDHLDFGSASFRLTNIEEIDAGAGNDTVTGTDAADAIRGNSGNDELHGGLGDDTFLTTGSGDGTDQIDGGSGNDTWLGSGGNDYFRVTDGVGNLDSVETIDGSGGYDKILGTSGADHLDFNDPSAPTITNIEAIDAAAGNDTVTMSDATDGISYVGNSGDDTFAFNTSALSATIADFDAHGNDVVDLTSFGTDLSTLQAHASNSGSDVVLDLSALGGAGNLTLHGVQVADLDFTGSTDFLV